MVRSVFEEMGFWVGSWKGECSGYFVFPQLSVRRVEEIGRRINMH